MMQSDITALVDWSRVQFALTAMYHWLFVPLTLGLSFLIAFMETLYVRTGDAKWKHITKFWMRLFGINFAIGVATGLILEFEFGTNWSNYSWFVGDIFGAPLAIEGIMAFFMESTFIAVMFFGWNKVSKRFHLMSTWLTAIGSNLSAVWILVANAWMQDPQGMQFNPDTARHEMVNFWDVFLSHTAVDKFNHTVMSSYMLASVFVIGVSAWYLLHNRERILAKRSILMASIFGLIAALATIYTGDRTARNVARNQPMKFAAMEAHFKGYNAVPLKALGIVGDADKALRDYTGKDDGMVFALEIPEALSWLTNGDGKSFVPGITDLLYGNHTHGILSTQEKIRRGHEAQEALLAYKEAKMAGMPEAEQLRRPFEDQKWMKETFRYFGYGSYYKAGADDKAENVLAVVPPISMTFYSFHIMVFLGFWFTLLFILMIVLVMRGKVHKNRLLLHAAVWSIPLVWICSECGWIVNEVGRQPWIIQDLMNTTQAVTKIDSMSVVMTTVLFGVVFTGLLIAEVGIMLKQIKKGEDAQLEVSPKDGGE